MGEFVLSSDDGKIHLGDNLFKRSRQLMSKKCLTLLCVLICEYRNLQFYLKKKVFPNSDFPDSLIDLLNHYFILYS